MAEDFSGAISSIEEIIEDARNGKMYILVDAEDRENEGDIIAPAQFATPEAINFMVRYARGLVCLAMTGERANALNLDMMTRDNRESSCFGNSEMLTLLNPYQCSIQECNETSLSSF